MLSNLHESKCFNPRTRTGCDRRLLLGCCQLSCFNPRTRTGCDRIRHWREERNRQFQSTHPHGVRHLALSVPIGGAIVSIHAPARGATVARDRDEQTLGVSIHAPARGATSVSALCQGTRTFQSTHPHGVRHLGESGYISYLLVSIHAPARGATSVHSRRRHCDEGFNPRTRTGCDRLFLHPLNPGDVSIHAPARGATTARPPIFVVFISFNPRTRTGCDLYSNIIFQTGYCFNPRTRTGCDRRRACWRRTYASFNPRTRTGCDFATTTKCGLLHGFNPRTRTGCDRSPQLCCARWQCFNPRTRTGCDSPKLCVMFASYTVSIHAPARGATQLQHALSLLIRVSIHAPARGATYIIRAQLHLFDVSIHAPARGATFATRFYTGQRTFQSTHPHGVRPATISRYV